MPKTPTFEETAGTVKMVREDHRQILALYQLYLAAEADSRQPIVEQILQRLSEHFQMEEGLLREVIQGQDDGRRALVEQILLEHEEVQAMISELRQAETDDDESMDEFFEDMMQTVRAHFIAEEREILPLFDTHKIQRT